LPMVKQAHILLGPIDCLALIECVDHEALHEAILSIRGVRGVVNTDTRYVYA
jgi:Lrp/AsnC ligand binding domain